MCDVVFSGFSKAEVRFLTDILQKNFYNTNLLAEVQDVQEVVDFADKHKIDLLFLRLENQTRATTFQKKALILEKQPTMRVILFDEQEDFEAVLTGLRCGAIDYLYAPFQEEACKKAIHRAILSLNQISLMNEKEIRSSDNKKATMNKLLLYIKDHYHESIQLKALANHVHLNEFYVSKLFKETLGMSFSKYLRKLRTERAKVELTQSTLTIKEVSEAVGVFDSAYFSRVFKEETGMTPMRYREQYSGHHVVSELQIELVES